jgi:hypothetical protein
MREETTMPNTPFEQANPETAVHLVELHEQMKKGEINIPELRRRYLKDFPVDGTMMLLQDIQRLSWVYKNLYEEIKRLDVRGLPAGELDNLHQPGASTHPFMNNVRLKYEQFGLVPSSYLPQGTTFAQFLGSAVDSTKKLFRGAVNIVKTYPEELGKAFLLEPGTTVVFQFSVGTGGQMTVGWERTIGATP